MGTWDTYNMEYGGTMQAGLFGKQPFHAWRASKQIPDEERPVTSPGRRDSVRRGGTAVRSVSSSSSSGRLPFSTSARGTASTGRRSGRLVAVSEGSIVTTRTSSTRSARPSPTAMTLTARTSNTSSARASPHVNLHVSRLRASSARDWDGLPVRTDLYSGFVPPTGEGQAEKRLIKFMERSPQEGSEQREGQQLQQKTGSSRSGSPLRSRTPLVRRSGQQFRAGTRAVAQKPLVLRERAALDSPISSLRPTLPTGSSVYIIAQERLQDESGKGVVRACVVDDLRLHAPILGWVSMAKKKEVLLQPASSQSAAPVCSTGERRHATLASVLEARHHAWERAWRLEGHEANERGGNQE